MPGLTRYRGLVFLALWQTAPVVVHQDSAGRVQVHFAAGGGRYEQVTTNCDGDVVGTQALAYTGGGAGVEAWPHDNVRLNGFGGATFSDSPEFDDINAGLLAALEFRHVGIGGGAAVVPGFERTYQGVTVADETTFMPIVYARIGNLDRWHLRFESSSATGLDRMGGFLRLGAGYNQGLLRGTNAFTGIALCHAGCEGDDGETAVLFLDLSRPISPRLDIRLGGVIGTGQENPEFGLTLGGTWMLRR